MLANNLTGNYCMNCAALLDDVQRNHRRVIVLDSQCAAVFSQSGDATRLDEMVKSPHVKHDAPEIPSHAHKQETAKVQETVHTKAKASEESKPAKRSKR